MHCFVFIGVGFGAIMDGSACSNSDNLNSNASNDNNATNNGNSDDHNDNSNNADSRSTQNNNASLIYKGKHSKLPQNICSDSSIFWDGHSNANSKTMVIAITVIIVVTTMNNKSRTVRIKWYG